MPLSGSGLTKYLTSRSFRGYQCLAGLLDHFTAFRWSAIISTIEEARAIEGKAKCHEDFQAVAFCTAPFKFRQESRKGEEETWEINYRS